MTLAEIDREALRLLRENDRILGTNVGERAYRATMALAQKPVIAPRN